MTDQLTADEKAYYQARLSIAELIVEKWNDERVEGNMVYLVAAVFEKIASPLHYLREGEPPKVDRVTGHISGAPKQKTRFKKSKAPDNAGFNEFAREDYVRADLHSVLQYLRIHRDDIKPHKGYIYKLNDFDQRDWLWRKKEAPK